MAKELLLHTSGACFLCSVEPLDGLGRFMSEVSLRSICRYLKISPSSLLRKPVKESLEAGEERVTPSQKEKYEFYVAMCSTCSVLTRKLTDLINELELINNLAQYQLQIFHRTISRRAQDSEISDKVEISLVDALRTEMDKKCSIKVEDAVTSSLPKVLLERLKSGNWQNPLSPFTKIDLTETQTSPPKDVKSPFQFPLQDPLCPSPPDTKLLVDPLSDQVIPPDTQSPRMDTISHNKLIVDLCKKYSFKSETKQHCSICGYSTGSYSAPALVRIHLVNAHPDIMFFSERPPHMDKLTFNESCRRLFSNEIFQSKERGGLPNGKLSYHCKICERIISCPNNFKYHLLTAHFEVMKHRLQTNILQSGSPSLEADGNSGTEDPVTYIVPDLVIEESKAKVPKRKSPKPKGHVFRKRISFICGVAAGGCGKIFSNRTTLLTHKRRQCGRFGKKGRLTCDCGQIFTTGFNLHRHQREHCSKRKKGATPCGFEKKELDGNNFSVKMECSVEDVVISKVEVVTSSDSRQNM